MPAGGGGGGGSRIWWLQEEKGGGSVPLYAAPTALPIRVYRGAARAPIMKPVVTPLNQYDIYSDGRSHIGRNKT